jgi:DNA-binding SARP family transcriptional activator/tetratricopeptide (TPR) repeat protein
MSSDLAAPARRPDLRVGVLGPLTVRLGSAPVVVPGDRSAVIMAVLAMSAGRPVTVEALAERVWGDRPPERVRGSLHSHVNRLRRLLGTDAVRTVATGYVLDVDPDRVDALRFRRLAAEAAGLDDLERTRDVLDEALALWRGEPFSGLRPEAFERDEIPLLVEERLAALQRRIDLDLAAGQHADVVALLRDLTARHPLREPLWHQLITALAGSGRQAEAIEAYHDLRGRLRDQLGIDPSADLQDLFRRLLTIEPPALDGPDDAGPRRAPAADDPPAPGPPNQLPPDADDFTGRSREVARLTRLLTAETRRTVPVCVVSGRAGAGKTALAVHVAHAMSGQFPDGSLHANLRGAEARPRDPAEVLGSFLRALGVDGRAIPEGVDARAELYRSLLAGARVLVVLDNAAGETQVRPLLPGSPSCAVLVTARRTLSGLEGAGRLELDMLAPEEAVELLGRVSGGGRVAAEAVEALEIVGLCDRLPLAVRIAGARLAARPHWHLARLAGRLSDERRRLDELVQGDLEVRASIELSYRGLDEPGRRAFRRLGLLDAPDFPAWVAAPLLDVTPDAAEELVERLRDARLLELSGSDAAGQLRFRFHDLLRLYARERVAAEEPAAERAAALRRMLDAWHRLVAQAEQRLVGGAPPGAGEPRGWELGATAADELLADPLAWLDAERPALLGAVAQACEADLDDMAVPLAAAMATYLRARGYFDEWRRTHELVLAVAGRRGNRGGEAVLLRGLGDLHTIQDRYEEALACFQRARVAFHEVGDRRGEAAVAHGTGFVLRLRASYAEALACFEQALAISTELGDRRERVQALHGIGMVRLDEGRVAEAVDRYRAALAEAREIGFHSGAARQLRKLGSLDRARGELDAAESSLSEALTLCRELGDRPSEVHVLLEIARLRRQQGRTEEARALLEECLDLYRRFGDRFNEAVTLETLGELRYAEGHAGEALEHLARASRIFDDLRLPQWRARALRRRAGMLARDTVAGGPQSRRST